MEQKKIAIGIDLEAHLKKSLMRTVQKWKDLPIKWHPADSLHIALLPIGWVGEDDVLHIIGKLAEVAQDTTGFSVSFSRVVAANKDHRITDPRQFQLVRVEGEDNDALRELYQRLCEALDLPETEKKHFAPHVTLGRMRARKWQTLEQLPEIDQPCPILMDVTHLTLFEQVNQEGQWTFEPIEIFEMQ